MAEDFITETPLGYSLFRLEILIGTPEIVRDGNSYYAKSEYLAGRTTNLEATVMDCRSRTLSNEDIADILRRKEQEGITPWLETEDTKLKLAYNQKMEAIIKKVKFEFRDKDGSKNTCDAYIYFNHLPTDETLTKLLNDYLIEHTEITELDISNTPITDNLYIPPQLKTLDIRGCKNISRIPRTSAKVLYSPSLMEIIDCPKQTLVSTENKDLENMTRVNVSFFGPHVERYVHRAMSDPRLALFLTKGVDFRDDSRLKTQWDSWGYTAGKDVPEMKLIFDLMYLALNGVSVSEKTSPGIEEQLRQILPNIDPDEISRIISQIDLNSARKVTDNTASLGVFSFDINGRRVFGKVSRNLVELRAAKKYMQIVAGDELLVGTAPQLVGLVEDEQTGLLLTYDVNDLAINTQREKLMRSLGISNFFIFDRALTHHRLQKYATDPVFIENISPTIIPFDNLLKRASDQRFDEFRREYQELTERFGDLELTDISLINFDPKAENVVNRIIVDCDKVKSGFTEEELARTTINAKGIVQYNKIRRKLANKDGIDYIPVDSKTVGMLRRIQAIRTASFLVGKNRFQEARMSLSS